jgi:excinuclease ABC subunit C
LFDFEEELKNLPEEPGVYLMHDDSDEIIYVGKAKILKNRVRQYFQKNPNHTPKVIAMVSNIAYFEYIVTDSETEALALECNLIKKYRPKYNILLKDDKSYPHLMLNLKEEYPALRKFRGRRENGCKYFGPYANATAVNEVVDTIQKVFMLRSCRNSAFQNRERPCLLYQIKRCSAPCCGKIDKIDYNDAVKDVVSFLEGKDISIQGNLSKKMQQASQNQDYEKALIFRDRIKALTNIQNHANLEYAGLKSVDIIAVAQRNNWFCIEIFFIRGGQNCGNVPYLIKQTEDTDVTEVLDAFLGSFYAEHLVPKEIYISEILENKTFFEEALNVDIRYFTKGDKYKLVENAKKNALAALDRYISEHKSTRALLEEMQQYFCLPSIPKRIEVYDNSHNQGSYAVGAMIVATPEGFDKKSYRTFNIKDPNITNDDFAMMKEVLTRRFEKMTEENRPDVILLDGGLGQLHAVHECLQNYDLSKIHIIAISKGPERNAGKEFYHQIGKESFALPYRSSIAFYLQNLRDEAHRFAIGTHRKKREKAITKSSLNDIDGIGEKRKRELLNHFGSVAAIKEASIEDISKISGISKKTAENIYNYFHK